MCSTSPAFGFLVCRIPLQWRQRAVLTFMTVGVCKPPYGVGRVTHCEIFVTRQDGGTLCQTVRHVECHHCVFLAKRERYRATKCFEMFVVGSHVSREGGKPYHRTWTRGVPSSASPSSMTLCRTHSWVSLDSNSSGGSRASSGMTAKGSALIERSLGAVVHSMGTTLGGEPLASGLFPLLGPSED